MRQLRLTKPAENDLLSIWQYIATDHPQAADNVLELIEMQLALLIQAPKMGRSCSSLAEGLWSLPTGKASWRSQYIIYYRLRGNDIEVIRVLEGHQNIDASYFK